MENLIKKIYSSKTLDKIHRDIKCLSKDTKYDEYTFLRDRLLSSLLVFIIVILFAKLGYLTAPFITVIYYYLFYYINITRKMNIRNLRLEKEALYFFEILTLTLESGRNLENALIVTCDNVSSEISSEFKDVVDETRYGKSLNEALEDMMNRTSSDTLKNIILNIIQTSEFGNSILDTLYNQVDFLREKQILEVKKRINTIPNKVSIISVIFIVPLIMILVVGPYVINLLS
ncbi:MAG: type II secretion system F family protein [Bacilli bacterium]|nr:type II secretion system F family protein [Bacilli bacterium]